MFPRELISSRFLIKTALDVVSIIALNKSPWVRINLSGFSSSVAALRASSRNLLIFELILFGTTKSDGTSSRYTLWSFLYVSVNFAVFSMILLFSWSDITTSSFSRRSAVLSIIFLSWIVAFGEFNTLSAALVFFIISCFLLFLFCYDRNAILTEPSQQVY